MTWRLPALADLTSIDPMALMLAGAGLVGFLAALVITCLCTWIARRRRARRAAKGDLPRRSPRPAKARAKRQEPVLRLRYEPAASPVPAILMLPAPEPLPVAASAEIVRLEEPSLLDFLNGNIEPWPKPAMEFLEVTGKTGQLVEQEPVPVPEVVRSHTPQAAKSLGLPAAVWERSHMLALTTEPIVVPLPVTPRPPPAAQQQPQPNPRKLGFIRLKQKLRDSTENSAVLYSRKVG